MRKDFVQVKDRHFEQNGTQVILRGWAFGSWMNFEHFMIGLPGTNSMIIEAFEEVYGKDRGQELIHKLLDCMIGEEDVRYLKETGINTIRIPFGYHYFLDDTKPDEFLEEGFRQLDRAVRLCAAHGLYVILDLHSVPGSQNTDWHSDNITGQPLFWKYRVFQDQAISLWEELAKRYADNPYIIGYDVLNEPGYDLTAEQINGFYDRAIASIRKWDPNHILFLEGIDFGRDFTPIRAFEDPQIAYTVHFYPFVLEENILDPELDDNRRMEIFTKIFERQLSETGRLGRPIWCGESGYEILDGQEEFYSLLLQHNISLAEERGISWNLWTYKDARCMGIVIPEKNSRWIALKEEIAKSWSHHREEMISMDTVREAAEKYYAPLTEKEAYDLDFRMRSIFHRIAVEKVLKPLLRQIPWEQMKEYPNDFLFANCDRREMIVQDIKNLITKYSMEKEEM